MNYWMIEPKINPQRLVLGYLINNFLELHPADPRTLRFKCREDAEMLLRLFMKPELQIVQHYIKQEEE